MVVLISCVIGAVTRGWKGSKHANILRTSFMYGPSPFVPLAFVARSQFTDPEGEAAATAATAARLILRSFQFCGPHFIYDCRVLSLLSDQVIILSKINLTYHLAL